MVVGQNEFPLYLFQELKSETRPMDLVQKMSGGQRQAVAIARTRLSNAKLVIMDEPTAALGVPEHWCYLFDAQGQALRRRAAPEHAQAA